MTKGDCIREMVNLLHNLKFLLMKNPIKDYIFTISGVQLNDFIHCLMSDLFYKQTSLQEDQYLQLEFEFDFFSVP